MPRFILVRRSFSTLHPIQKWWSLGLMITILFPLLNWGMNQTLSYVPENFQALHSTLTTVCIVIYLILTAPAQAFSFPLSYGLSTLAIHMDSVRNLLEEKGFGGAVSAFEGSGTWSDASTFLFNATLLQNKIDLVPTVQLALQFGNALLINSLFFAGIGWCFAETPRRKWLGLGALAAIYMISLYFMVSLFAENDSAWGYWST